MSILLIWNKKRESQYKRLVLLYKAYNLKMNKIYGLPNLITSIAMGPLGFSYLLNLIFLRFFSFVFDYTALAFAFFKHFDKRLIKISGNLPSNKQKCRILLIYAKECEFSEFDFGLAETYFKQFEGHKTLVINCDCRNARKTHDLGIDPDYQMIKPNWGYDFDGYAAVVERFSKCDFSTLTFLNNSVVVTQGDNTWVNEMEQMALEQNGIVGLIESISPITHFQSFAFTFSRDSLSQSVINWFARVRPLKRKQAIIRFYELGLAHKIAKLSINVSYLFRFADLEQLTVHDWREKLGVYFDTEVYQTIFFRTSNGLGANPTHHHWRFILDAGLPLVKKELIASNPQNLPDVYDFIRHSFPNLLGVKLKAGGIS